MIVVDPTSQLCFRFIRMSMGGIGIGGPVGLAIGGAVLTGVDIAIGFFRLFLW